MLFSVDTCEVMESKQAVKKLKNYQRTTELWVIENARIRKGTLQKWFKFCALSFWRYVHDRLWRELLTKHVRSGKLNLQVQQLDHDIALASDDVTKHSNAWQRGKLVLNKDSVPYKSMRGESLTGWSCLFFRREVWTVLTTPSQLSASGITQVSGRFSVDLPAFSIFV